MKNKLLNLLTHLLRLSLGFTFLWAFFDKLIGLNFSTAPENSWLNGTSPTTGFLLHATKGPLSSLFQALANQPIIDWLFMLGLLFVGLGLMLGIDLKLTSLTGSLILFLIYLASALPPEHNPLIDDHVIYIIILLSLAIKNEPAGPLSKIWRNISLVKKYPILE